jgi:adenosylcobinamide kinase / adenosylcobinamide-phosphate guanylyltransferase
MTLTLITGPARSGKSEWAEQLAQRSIGSINAADQPVQSTQSSQPTQYTGKCQQVVYIATAQRNADDAEWQARIEQHRQRRPPHWHCEEVPIALSEAIATYNQTHCLLIDSLGTWLANLIEQSPTAWAASQAQLLSALEATSADVILVAEETGWGVVPAYELGRRFRDRLGSLTRQVGAIATEVYLVTGGYALSLSQLGQPVGNHESYSEGDQRRYSQDNI